MQPSPPQHVAQYPQAERHYFPRVFGCAASHRELDIVAALV